MDSAGDCSSTSALHFPLFPGGCSFQALAEAADVTEANSPDFHKLVFPALSQVKQWWQWHWLITDFLPGHPHASMCHSRYDLLLSPKKRLPPALLQCWVLVFVLGTGSWVTQASTELCHWENDLKFQTLLPPRPKCWGCHHTCLLNLFVFLWLISWYH